MAVVGFELISRFNTPPMFYVLNRRSSGGNIYKQLDLGGLMFVMLAIEIWGVG
jgi:hypothetical protein